MAPAMRAGLAPFLEERAVGDFVGQRMLEGVFGIGKEARLVQKLCRLQMREPPLHRLLRQLRHGVEQHEGHVLADDRGRLEQLLVVRREPVDPGRQDHLHGRRDLDRLDRPGETKGPALPGERTRLHQRPNGLLQEERVAALDEELLKRGEPGVVAEKSFQQLPCTLGRKRVEPHLTVEGLAPPAVLVLGPVVHEQKQARRAQALDYAVEQCLGLAIDPVEIFEDQEEGLLPCFP
jgi:hypothetical protein